VAGPVQPATRPVAGGATTRLRSSRPLAPVIVYFGSPQYFHWSHTLKNMFTPQQFESLLPLACTWAAEQEQLILKTGVPLTDVQMADARKIGVAHPEKVRLLKVERIPGPTDPILAMAAKATNFLSENTEGMTIQHGIFIRSDCWEKRLLVAHELVHTTQYER